MLDKFVEQSNSYAKVVNNRKGWSPLTRNELCCFLHLFYALVLVNSLFGDGIGIIIRKVNIIYYKIIISHTHRIIIIIFFYESCIIL